MRVLKSEVMLVFSPPRGVGLGERCAEGGGRRAFVGGRGCSVWQQQHGVTVTVMEGLGDILVSKRLFGVLDMEPGWRMAHRFDKNASFCMTRYCHVGE